MTVYLLFHPQDNGKHPMTYIVGDFWCSLFRIKPVLINCNDARVPSEQSGVLCFKTLDEAINSDELQNLTWVWFDFRAETYLDQYKHPEDNVIYCLGDDYNGFGDTEINGDFIRVRIPAGEVHSSLIVPLICYSQHVALNGKDLLCQ